MRPPLRKYLVQGPSLYAPEVLGFLSGVGGLVDEMRDEDGTFTVLVQLPAEALQRVEQWLSDATGGKAKLHAVQSANDDDI